MLDPGWMWSGAALWHSILIHVSPPVCLVHLRIRGAGTTFWRSLICVPGMHSQGSFRGALMWRYRTVRSLPTFVLLVGAWWVAAHPVVCGILLALLWTSRFHVPLLPPPPRARLRANTSCIPFRCLLSSSKVRPACPIVICSAATYLVVSSTSLGYLTPSDSAFMCLDGDFQRSAMYALSQ